MTGAGSRPVPAGEQRADPGHQDREREGLGQVVVGAGVECLRLVEVAVLGGEHQDRGPVPGLPEVRADLVAVAAREQDVEDDQVVAALGGQPEPVGAVESHLDGEPLGLEAAFDRWSRSSCHPRRGGSSRSIVPPNLTFR